VPPKAQPSCGQKRRRSATTTATSQFSRENAKRRCQPQQETNTVDWDSLSNLWLTQRALDELHRRNRRVAQSTRIAVARNLNLTDKPSSSKSLSKHLKSFARHGGPDHGDLRGVSLAQRGVEIVTNFGPLVSRTRQPTLRRNPIREPNRDPKIPWLSPRQKLQPRRQRRLLHTILISSRSYR